MTWHDLLDWIYVAIAALGFVFICYLGARAEASLIDRARQALADNNARDVADVPWRRWVDLRPDGTVVVGRKCFLIGTPFDEVAARDERYITRASVSADAKEILIKSHGQRWIARYVGAKWQVLLVEELADNS